MENVIDGLKSMLESQISIKVDETNLTLSLNFKGEKKNKSDLGEESEVRDMLKIIGGLSDEIQMDMDIDEESQKIIMFFKNKEDIAIVHNIFENLWEKAATLLKKAFLGDFSAIKDLDDFSE